MISCLLVSCGTSNDDASSPLTFTSTAGDGLELSIPAGYVDITSVTKAAMEDSGSTTDALLLEKSYSLGTIDYSDTDSANVRVILISRTDDPSEDTANSHEFCGQAGVLDPSSNSENPINFMAYITLNDRHYSITFASLGNVEDWTESEVKDILATCPSS